MKTKLSPSWIAIVVILWIIAIGALLENQVFGFVFFLAVSGLVVYFKSNTPEVDNNKENQPFPNHSSKNGLT